MKTQTLTQTKTKTITTTRMLTATLALALANGLALSAVPLQDRPVLTVGAQCPVVSVEFQNSCENGGFSQAMVTCEGAKVELLIDPGACVSAQTLETQALLVCQQECPYLIQEAETVQE